MRHLRQQISGLVPLDDRGSPKLPNSASEKTPFPSQRTTRTETASTTLSGAAATARSNGSSRLLSVYPFTDLRTPKAPEPTPVTPLPQPPMWPSKVPLSLDSTVQLITDVYDSKSVADIAALRQRAPCKPMRVFVQQYLQVSILLLESTQRNYASHSTRCDQSFI